MVLTVADINKLATEKEHNRDKMSMTLHGPMGLDKFYRATRHFMAASDVCVQCVQPGVSSELLEPFQAFGIGRS